MNIGGYMFFNKKLKLQIIFGLNENNEFEMKHNLETQGQYILMALSYYVKVAWIFADGDKYAFEEMIRLTNEVDEDSIISLKSLELVEDFKTTDLRPRQQVQPAAHHPALRRRAHGPKRPHGDYRPGPQVRHAA